MKKKKVIAIVGIALLAVAAVAAVFLLRGRDKSGEPEVEEPEPLPVVEAPQQYELEEDTVLALPVGKNIVVTLEELETEEPEEEEEEPEEPEEGEEGEEEAQKSEPAKPIKAETKKPEDAVVPQVIYHYTGIKGTGNTVSAYASILTGEDFGFVVYDKEMKAAELPELSDNGRLLLVRSKPPKTEGETEEAEPPANLLGLRLSWTAEDCNVEVCQVPKEAVAVRQMPRPEPLSIVEAVDYLYAFPPAKLGLSGTNMRDYQVLAMDGAVMVDGAPCLRMNVYGTDPKTGTNYIAGQFLFSNEDRSLYEVAPTGGVERIIL